MTVAEVTYSNSISVAEHVVMMILTLVRIYIPSYGWVISGGSERRGLRRSGPTTSKGCPSDRSPPVASAPGVLRRLKGFDVDLHYTDRHRLPAEVGERTGADLS